MRKSRKYAATIYADGPDARQVDSTEVYKTERENVDPACLSRLPPFREAGAAV